MPFTWPSGSTPTRSPARSCGPIPRSRSTPGRKLNPSGFATKAQREEAKEAAKARAEAEAADGRFRRHNHYPVLWDGQTQTLYAGTTSTTVLDRLQALFRETFDRTLEPITAGSLARSLTLDDPSDPGRRVGDPRLQPDRHGRRAGRKTRPPSPGPGTTPPASTTWATSSWSGSGTCSRTTATRSSSPTARRRPSCSPRPLTLDCPRGETGRDQLTDDAPTRLPEAFRALQAGKLPRKAGMIARPPRRPVRADPPGRDPRRLRRRAPQARRRGLSRHEQRIARIDSLRHLTETLDLLFEAYLLRRTGSGWTDELGRIRRWLQAA